MDCEIPDLRIYLFRSLKPNAVTPKVRHTSHPIHQFSLVCTFKLVRVLNKLEVELIEICGYVHTLELVVVKLVHQDVV